MLDSVTGGISITPTESLIFDWKPGEDEYQVLIVARLYKTMYGQWGITDQDILLVLRQKMLKDHFGRTTNAGFITLKADGTVT